MINIEDLPEIDFCDKDADSIETSLITSYEKISGRSLASGDPVRLFLETIAAVIVQQRVLIDFSAKQNLLAYSSGNYLDHLGALLGVARLSASSASTTVRFTLSAVQASAVAIPLGTRIAAGEIIFSTTEAAEIPAGKMSIDVNAACLTSGAAGNDYLAGQISQLVDPIPYVSSAANITVSNGGSDQEDDGNLRDRIRQVPESFSTAGPVGAYKYWAKTAHQDVSDVAVYSPSPGVVEIRPLGKNGSLPSPEMLGLVKSACTADAVRPLTDSVNVSSPEQVGYSLDVTYWIARDDAAVVSGIQSSIETAIGDYMQWQKAVLGRDINPSVLTAKIQGAGALRCEVRSPSYAMLECYQVGSNTDKNIVYGGLEEG